MVFLKRLMAKSGTCRYITRLQSYLTTSQGNYIKIGSMLSREIKAHSGVPQRSHLGPVIIIFQ